MLRNLNLLWALITYNKTLINPLKHKFKFQRTLPSTIIFFISGFKVTRLLKSIAIAWRNLWLTPIVPHKNKDIVTKLCYWLFDGPLRRTETTNNFLINLVNDLLGLIPQFMRRVIHLMFSFLTNNIALSSYFGDLTRN